MRQLLYNFSIQVGHENIITAIQRPYVFITILTAIRNGRTTISRQVSGCVDHILPVFCKKRTGRSAFSGADKFILELFSRFWDFARIYLVTGNSIFYAGTLKYKPLS